MVWSPPLLVKVPSVMTFSSNAEAPVAAPSAVFGADDTSLIPMPLVSKNPLLMFPSLFVGPNSMECPSALAKVRPQSPFESWVADTVIGNSPV